MRCNLTKGTPNQDILHCSTNKNHVCKNVPQFDESVSLGGLLGGHQRVGMSCHQARGVFAYEEDIDRD